MELHDMHMTETKPGWLTGVTIGALTTLAMRLAIIAACGRYMGWW